MSAHLKILRDFHALSFHRAYELCWSRPDLGVGLPALICAAFSAEIGLKELLRQSGVSFGKVHALKDLFDLLPTDAQNALRTEVVMEFPNFDALLAEGSNAFVDWRYFFEKQQLVKVNVRFIGSLAGAILGKLDSFESPNKPLERSRER